MTDPLPESELRRLVEMHQKANAIAADGSRDFAAWTEYACAANEKAPSMAQEIIRLREALTAHEDMYQRGILNMTVEEVEAVHAKRRATLPKETD